jgi:hypothetical protein
MSFEEVITVFLQVSRDFEEAQNGKADSAKVLTHTLEPNLNNAVLHSKFALPYGVPRQETKSLRNKRRDEN